MSSSSDSFIIGYKTPECRCLQWKGDVHQVKMYNQIMDLYQTYWPQSICLTAQLSITVVTIIRILDNRDEFPVRQLGPASTIICALCFFFSSLINLIGRIMVKNSSIESPCKIYESESLFVLGILYNMMRQLPFVLFTVKTLRVSLCFWPRFNKINIEDINKCFVNFLKNQSYFVYASLSYVALINLLNLSAGGVDSHSSALTFEFFCPKEPGIIDFIVSVIRLLTMAFVLYLSLWTYDQLDFKKFLFYIFLISNLSIIPRLLLVKFETDRRDPIYYTSFMIELLNNCLVLYYSGINKQLNQPAMQGVLQSWPAFHNLKLGMNVLANYAEYKDSHSQVKYNFRCLESFDYLDELLKECNINRQFQLKNELGGVGQILQRNQLVKAKLGQTTTAQYRRKCADGTLSVEMVKKIEKILSNYCESVIFGDWKKTKSYQSLRQEFINNGDINEKLALFGIPVN